MAPGSMPLWVIKCSSSVQMLSLIHIYFDMVALETVNNQYLGGDTSLACSAQTLSLIHICHSLRVPGSNPERTWLRPS